MVLTWIVGPVLSMMSTLFSVLPTGHLPFGSGTSGYGTGTISESAGPAGWANSWFHTAFVTASYFFPMQEAVDILAVVVTIILPAVFVYELAQWGYRELPHIAGFGS